MFSWLSNIDWNLVIAAISAIGTVGLGLVALIQNTRLNKINKQLQERDALAKLHTLIVSNNSKETVPLYHFENIDLFDANEKSSTILVPHKSQQKYSDVIQFTLKFKSINGIYPTKYHVKNAHLTFSQHNELAYHNANTRFKDIDINSEGNLYIYFQFALCSDFYFTRSELVNTDYIGITAEVIFKTAFSTITITDFFIILRKVIGQNNSIEYECESEKISIKKIMTDNEYNQ